MFPCESRGGVFTFPQATLAHPEWRAGNICLVPALNQSHCLRPARWAVWAVPTRGPLEAPNLESPPSLLGTGGIPRLLRGPLQGTEFSPVREGARPRFLPSEGSPAALCWASCQRLPFKAVTIGSYMSTGDMTT